MEKVFIISIFVTLLFCVVKFLEMKFVDKEIKPLKYVVRDSLIVLLCTSVATTVVFNMNNSISEFFNVVTDSKTINPSSTEIFTDAPGF
jgi:hypothetical protein